MYEKDGEKYFVFDSHLHFWDASPGELEARGPEEYAKGWIECFHAYQGLGPARDPLDDRALPEVLGRRLREGRLRRGPRGHGGVPVDVPEGVVHERVQRHRAERRAARPLPRQADRQRPLGPARGGRPASQLEADHAKYGIQGVKLYTAEWNDGSRGWKLTDPEAVPFLDMCADSASRTSTSTRARRSGRWTRTRSTSPTSTTSRRTTTATELHRRARRPAADRGLLLHGDAGAQRLRRPVVVIGGLMLARPRFFAKVMGELLFWVGEDKMLFGSDYAIWEPKWQVEGLVDWEMPDDDPARRLPAPGRRGQEEDPRPQRRQAVRRRRARGVPAAGAGRRPRVPRHAVGVEP